MIRCRVANIYVVWVLWDHIVQQGCSSWFHKTLKCLIFRLVLGSTIYNIWLTRNELIHAGHPCSEEQILKKIVWEVRTRIVGKGKFPSTRENTLLCSLWNLHAEILV
jgi:hypothetical protein